MTTTLGVLALYLSHLLEQRLMDAMRQKLLTQLRISADMIEQLVRTQDDARVITSRTFFRGDARRVTLLTTDGYIIAESPSNASQPTTPNHLPPEIREAIRRGRGGEGTALRVNPDTGEQTKYSARRIRLLGESGGLSLQVQATPFEPGKPAPRPIKRTVKDAVLVLAAPTTDVEGAITEMKSAIGWIFIGGMVVFLFIYLGVSSYMVQPLIKLSAVAERFAEGDLKERVRPAGVAEIASLGSSFNMMAEELRRTITRLAEERAQAQAMLVSMADGVLVTDPNGIVLLVNQSAEEMCSIDGRQVIGQPLAAAINHPDIDALLSRTLTTRLSLQQEVSFHQPVLRAVEVHMAPVEVEGRLFGAVITLYDITPRRAVEQMQRDFVANVSHELRTPVTSIRAMAETLLDGGKEEPEMTDEFLGTIIGESDRLSALLDDLLNLSRIESGQRELKLELLEVREVIQHVANRVISPIKAKGQRLILNVPERLQITADRDALVQILVNLLDNARKYSPDRATITITADYGESMRITVADTGYGISREDMTRIFERFYRVDKARSRAQGGTGLGLAIVQHLVEQQHGQISVTSELGVGSQFTVVFPLPNAATMSGEAGELPADRVEAAPRDLTV